MTKLSAHTVSVLTTFVICPLITSTALLGVLSCTWAPPPSGDAGDNESSGRTEEESTGRSSNESEDASSSEPSEETGEGETTTSSGSGTSTGSSTSAGSTTTSTTSTSGATTSSSTSDGDDTSDTSGGLTEDSDSSVTEDTGAESTAGCGLAAPGNGRKTINVNGSSREYILRVPDNYDPNQPYRLVMAYHWLGGNADQVANGGGGGSTEDPFYGLWDLADNSTIFVAPEGLDAGWANSGDRDIAFTDAMLDLLFDELCIDTTRIFATGFSYGAGMSYALACARADVFRGVALYAGAQLSGCSGGNTPIAYFHVHGLVDSVLSVAQGRQLRDRYVGVNGCTPQNPPEPSPNSGTHICTSYEGCSDGYPVRWCAHGGDHNPTEKDQGQNDSWVPPEAWAFISQF